VRRGGKEGKFRGEGEDAEFWFMERICRFEQVMGVSVLLSNLKRVVTCG